LYNLFDKLIDHLTLRVVGPLDPSDRSQVTDKTRKLGLVVVRGVQISLIAPSDEMEEIANPFTEADGEGEEPSSSS
jgi:hypothetical protein